MDSIAHFSRLPGFETGSRNPSRAQIEEVPFTTVHAGRIEGGMALNIVPGRCALDVEIRNLVEDDMDALVREVRAAAEAIGPPPARAFRRPGCGSRNCSSIRVWGLRLAPRRCA